jgi:hypothetical protein
MLHLLQNKTAPLRVGFRDEYEHASTSLNGSSDSKLRGAEEGIGIEIHQARIDILSDQRQRNAKVTRRKRGAWDSVGGSQGLMNNTGWT